MAEAPRSRLPSGYDENSVSADEDENLCLICHLLLKEPVLTSCGHGFCKECPEEHSRRQGAQDQPLTCPADREGLNRDRDVFPDKATERNILSFAIKCPSKGCDWTGELRSKEVHLAPCLFKFVSCTNENCRVTLQRRDLEEHVTTMCQWRILECDHWQ
ncbi:TNF receptor-associated factor 6-B-like [Orbicella faveolata]|uniref:TNF receptor-associated factor 6-B-like n=1 Tax=Orbicella faveolata TaxID=48498 RepID=UPI0009E3E564|nr:TNF receptor-associated factor 6-B-like [Orbicella faveolata]